MMWTPAAGVKGSTNPHHRAPAPSASWSSARPRAESHGSGAPRPPLLQPHIRFVILDQAFQACLHLGRHARAAVGLLARIAVLGLAHQHLAHLGVHEVIEQPAVVRQDLARAADLLLAIVTHWNTSHPSRNPQ